MLSKFFKFLTLVFWFLTALFLIVFSVSNREVVNITLLPIGFVHPTPAYQILFLGIFIGALITGTSLSWLRLKGFTKRRKAERDASNLEKQVSAMGEDLHNQNATAAHKNKGEDALVSLPK